MEIPNAMRAMVLEEPGKPLQAREVAVPKPQAGQVLLRVHACGVCRTDLHIVDGELPCPKLPLILGHQIVGTIVQLGDGRPVPRSACPTVPTEGTAGQARRGTGEVAAGRASRGTSEHREGGAAAEPYSTELRLGDRVGVPWLGGTCGACRFCRRGQENLCDDAAFTGYTLDGGFAEFATANRQYVFPIPQGYDDLQAAPFLCAGLIGYRTYRMAGDEVEHLGIYGFGAAAHIVAQIAIYQGKKVYAFTRDGDAKTQEFARRLGAVWASGSGERPPAPLDAALVFAPAGACVPAALRACGKGGTVVCGGIHMSDIPSFPYSILWEERVLRSVANLTRRDGQELLAIAPKVPVRTQIEVFPLDGANEALSRIRSGQLEGAAVLRVWVQ